MGLHTSHNCWHGPYSLFNRFRKELAAQIGINLDEYIGYAENGKGIYLLRNIKHDIQPLLYHSDCEGKLLLTECRKIRAGLLSIYNGLKDKPEPYPGFIDHISTFIKGLEKAIDNRQQVIFR